MNCTEVCPKALSPSMHRADSHRYRARIVLVSRGKVCIFELDLNEVVEVVNEHKE